MKITLRAARVNANIKQEEAARAIGVDKATIINWEKGRTSPRLDQMDKLCRLYNAPIDDIFLPR